MLQSAKLVGELGERNVSPQRQQRGGPLAQRLRLEMAAGHEHGHAFGEKEGDAIRAEEGGRHQMRRFMTHHLLQIRDLVGTIVAVDVAHHALRIGGIAAVAPQNVNENEFHPVFQRGVERAGNEVDIGFDALGQVFQIAGGSGARDEVEQTAVGLQLGPGRPGFLGGTLGSVADVELDANITVAAVVDLDPDFMLPRRAARVEDVRQGEVGGFQHRIEARLRLDREGFATVDRHGGLDRVEAIGSRDRQLKRQDISSIVQGAWERGHLDRLQAGGGLERDASRRCLRARTRRKGLARRAGRCRVGRGAGLAQQRGTGDPGKRENQHRKELPASKPLRQKSSQRVRLLRSVLKRKGSRRSRWMISRGAGV